MWTRLTVSDVALIERWVAVMRPMNGNYNNLKVADVRGGMATGLGETWYYCSERGEIALRFEFMAKRQRYQLYNAGFLGVLEPTEALDLAVERFKCFLLEHQIESLFALRPKNMDDPGIEAFHRLVPTHPQIVVTVCHNTPRMIMWELSHCDILERGAFSPLESVAAL